MVFRSLVGIFIYFYLFIYFYSWNKTYIHNITTAFHSLVKKQQQKTTNATNYQK